MPEIKQRISDSHGHAATGDLYDMEDAPFTLKVAPAVDGGGDPAVRVCDLDARPGALRWAPNGTPQPPPKEHWLLGTTTHRPPHVVRQGSQGGTMWER